MAFINLGDTFRTTPNGKHHEITLVLVYDDRVNSRRLYCIEWECFCGAEFLYYAEKIGRASKENMEIFLKTAYKYKERVFDKQPDSF